MSKESSTRQPSPEPVSIGSVPGWERRVPLVLSTIAGTVDVIGLLSFQLFTAHITGNLVVIAALLVRGGPPDAAQVLAVPAFILAVCIVWIIGKESGRQGPDLARPFLLIQFLLLLCVLIISVIYSPAKNPHGALGVITPLLAVSAMASQYTLLRVAAPSSPSTAVMTGNMTFAWLTLLDKISGGKPLVKTTDVRMKETAGALIGFFSGCLAGAAAVTWLGNWSWLLPVVLAGIAIILL
jgi:uncharacterized membrane protein YoaK (UPF0700 family)